MKWLIGFLLALFMVSAAFAGEDPYIAIVGNDIEFNQFYFSEKHWQFLYDQDSDLWPPVCDPFSNVPLKDYQTRVGDTGCEMFKSNQPIKTNTEICDTLGGRGEPNAAIMNASAGFYEWWIRLPKAPSGEINICIQCGVLKGNAFAGYGRQAVMLCAAETGEKLGTGFCTREYTGPGVSPICQQILPKIEAKAYPGPYTFYREEFPADGFHLTAYKNPSNYNLTPFVDNTTKQLKNTVSLQVLDGTNGARVLLKSCMDKCIVAKIPVYGQMNALGELEYDLTAGDLIKVRMVLPGSDPSAPRRCRSSETDIYCHSQSVKIVGIGESPF